MPARSMQNTTGARCSPQSRFTWSKARLRNVLYTAKNGRSPPIAMPTAEVTACCSAMPTSMQRSPKCSRNGSSPVESGIAAVMATTSGCRPPSLTIISENMPV